MSNYCDFNPKLFKQFVSIGKKINPAMADDWEIIPTAHVRTEGFSLYSKKLNQKVADINLRRFLRFSKEQNLTIIGLNLQGSYIIGSDRAVYTEEMYNTWREKFEERTETIIPKSEWKVGHEYMTPCGQTHIYLGARYVSNIKASALKNRIYNEYTKVSLKHFTDSGRYLSEFKGKFTKDLGQKLTIEEVDDILLKHYNKNLDITCFEKEKPSNIKYGFIETNPEKKYYAYSGLKALFVKVNEEMYVTSDTYGHYLSLKYRGQEITMPEGDRPKYGNHNWDTQAKLYEESQVKEPGFYINRYRTINPETFKLGELFDIGRGYYRKEQPELKADKILRIGLIKED